LGVWFELRVGFEAQQLTISVTPEYGDCDLYVKFTNAPFRGYASTDSPGIAQISRYDYSSNEMGRTIDKVLISENDICQDCWISILVYGYQSSKFSILATFTDDTILLTNGLPVKGSVASYKIQYYQFTTVSNCSVTAVVTLLSGRGSALVPYIYISSFTQRPNATTSFTSTDTNTDPHLPQITLPNLVSGTNVFVGVGGNNINGSYTIRINEDTSVPTLLTLLDAVPQV
jgi:hypothetical protein